jgi:hypothetical protein
MSGLHCNQSVGLPSSSDVGYSQPFIQRGYRDVTCERACVGKCRLYDMNFLSFLSFWSITHPYTPSTFCELLSELTD